jgi:methylase of polypeptide subunit release factors
VSDDEQLDVYDALEPRELLELLRVDAVDLSARALELAERAAAHHDALARVADLLDEEAIA